MKVALVHEFLTQLGGAERVLEAFHEIFPEAPVYTLVYDKRGTKNAFLDWKIKTSFLQNLPVRKKRYKWLLPLMSAAIESFDFSGFDLVLSDSSAFAKGIKTSPLTTHICYCHTPTRYLWESMDEYVANLPYVSIVKRAVKIYLKRVLKPWDHLAAWRPNFFIANSQNVAFRINKYYGRESEVIYPPVDSNFFQPAPSAGDYFLTASRLEPYKKIDLVIESFNRLGLKLLVAGEGTETKSLKRKAKNNIKFLGRITDERLRDLYGAAQAFIFPAEEDAGIATLEALSCGTPVIGYEKGGTAEFVKDGVNGLLLKKQEVEAIVQAVKRLDSIPFDRRQIRDGVLKFDKEIFKRKVTEFIKSHANRD